MLKTKDNYEIKIGMWLYDHDRIVEIKEINENDVLVNEIGFLENENPESYEIIDTYYLTIREIKNFLYI